MTTLNEGMKAPDFTLKDAEGNAHTLSEALKQGPVLLAFYKDTCPVCQYAFPFVERVQQGTDTGKARVWGISQDDARSARAFAEEYGCTFPMLVDEEGYPVSNQYEITHVPTTFLVETDGTIAQAAAGFDRGALETAAVRFGELSGTTITVVEPGEAVPDTKPG